MDGYEEHMMCDKSVYVEDPMHAYWREQERQLWLAYKRAMAESPLPYGVAMAAYQASDRPYSIFK